MSRTILLIASLVCAVLLFGCSKSETMNNSNSTASSERPATSTPAAGTASSTGDKIGVPECDDFIAKYEACASKVPEMARAQYQSALKQWRESWKRLAENPSTKGSLAAACKQAAEQQAAAWKMYGCAN
jgi:hypothetical protein